MAGTLNVTELIEAVLTENALPWDGPHGVMHWGRVLENGLRLAEDTGVSRDIVTLFAVFHDSRRFNEGSIPITECAVLSWPSDFVVNSLTSMLRNRKNSGGGHTAEP